MGATDGPVVVVGAGVAGVRVVRRLRARKHDGPIVLVDAQDELPYDRPPLSKAVLRGERDLPVLLDLDQLASLDIDWRPGHRVIGLDAAERRVLLDDGTEVAYGALVVATGARARRVPGLGGEVLRTWADAVRLRSRVSAGSSVVVVGAGVVGCEVAASLRAVNVEVHLVDPLPAPMERVLGPVLGQEAAELHHAQGVHLHLRTTVASWADGIAVLADGTRLRADVLVESIGAEPDVAWLAGLGLHTDDGVLCDHEQRTGLPDVYVVGDAAAPEGRRAEHWTAATHQADRVVATILGTPPPAAEPPYWWSDQYDVKLQGLGSAEAEEVVVAEVGAGRVALLATAGRVVGAIGLSAPGALMKLRAAVVDGRPITEAVAILPDARWLSTVGGPA